MIKLLSETYANTYLYYTDDRDSDGFSHGMLVDCSASPGLVSKVLESERVVLDYIIITHGHYDHLMNYEELVSSFPNAMVLCGKEEVKYFQDIDANVSYLFNDPKTYPEPQSTVTDGSVITLLNDKFEVMITPGHTDGSLCLYCGEKSILFTGDLLFVNGIGRTDFKYGDYHTIVNSLRRIAKLPGNTKFYAGHGEVGLLSWEFS